MILWWLILAVFIGVSQPLRLVYIVDFIAMLYYVLGEIKVFDCLICLFVLKKREERQLELEKNHAFIDDERRKTMERLRQYKMVRSVNGLLAKCAVFMCQ